MKRNDFIKNSALLAFSLSACGSVISSKNEVFETDCETTNDILGPFYRPNSPKRNNLLFKGIDGSEIKIKGQVFSSCKEILNNAQIEIWHCNTDGEYDNVSEQFLHRGQTLSTTDGAYEFTTIFPGKYKNGKLYRPAHIHFRVTHPSCKELISQIYFQGDPHITQDPWASNEKAEKRILPFIPEDINGNLSIQFDIYLSKK